VVERLPQSYNAEAGGSQSTRTVAAAPPARYPDERSRRNADD